MGVIVLNMIGRTITPLLSWCLYHSDPTPLARNMFAMHYYLVLTALYGFVLGLIPLYQIRETLSSSFANFYSKSDSTPHRKLDFTQPILWAWLPVGTLFFLRFVTWHSPDASVIATAADGRLRHFFFPPYTYTMNLFLHSTQIWIFDRYALTGPTIFLLAYPFGVWFHRQLPSRSDQHPTAI